MRLRNVNWQIWRFFFGKTFRRARTYERCMMLGLLWSYLALSGSTLLAAKRRERIHSSAIMTEHFNILEHQNPAISKFYGVRKRRLAILKTPKFVEMSGREMGGMLDRWSITCDLSPCCLTSQFLFGKIHFVSKANWSKASRFTTLWPSSMPF